MATRVFYSSWQLQCCGDGFAIGDTVSWTALPAEPDLLEQLGPAEGNGATRYVVTLSD